jgi:HSP20 family protein
MSLGAAHLYGDLTALREAINRLIDECSGSLPAPGARRSIPLDVYETADDLVVLAALPGVAADAVHLTATADTLTIRAKLPSAAERPEAADWTWYLHEIPHGEAVRTINLPIEVAPEQAQATFQGGVLRLALPKGPKPEHRLSIQGEAPAFRPGGWPGHEWTGGPGGSGA